MSEKPSARRRKGREAYYRGGNPVELNPYMLESHRDDWRSGWGEAWREDRLKEDVEIERDTMRAMPITYAIDQCDADESVKEILRRIAEHVGME